MYNEEIYQKINEEFGFDDIDIMPLVCEIISKLYDIKFNASKSEDGITEFDYERDWWMNKYKELINKIETKCQD